MDHECERYVVAALYKFARLPDHVDLRGPLLEVADGAGVFGTLLLAREGINGTIAGSREGIDAVLAWIKAVPGLEDLSWKESFAPEMPFLRMKVRLKSEIVTMGVDAIDPALEVGTYVAPEDWNALISDPDTIVVDTRNSYEVEIGSFEGARDPKTETFREFPLWAETNLDKAQGRRIAMFCTGGIRCEKATAYLKRLGFEDVFHLQGGILKYLETVPEAESRWRGECFVFDRRVSVGHGLQPGPYQLCSICREPFRSGDASGGYADKPCDRCERQAGEAKKRRARARQEQIELAETRGGQHMGQVKKPA